jgi:hypothetical protein
MILCHFKGLLRVTPIGGMTPPISPPATLGPALRTTWVIEGGKLHDHN